MFIKDGIARRQLEVIRQEIKEGAFFTKPWFDLDVEEYRAYIPGPIVDHPSMNSSPEPKNIRSDFYHLASLSSLNV